MKKSAPSTTGFSPSYCSSCSYRFTLFALGEIPAGLNLDEVGMAYDAWCLANYGVDRYLKPFPVYLTNYGGGQSAMYAWLAAGLIALTGSASSLVLRLPAMAFGLMAMAFGALAVHEIMGKKHPKAWFAFGLFYLVCPYFTMASRSSGWTAT